LCIINIYIKLKNKKKMKKVIAIFAIATTLVACGGKGTTEATTDSTAVVVDSTAVTATDSTTAEIPAETPATEAAVEKTK
jgi:ABC-type glycerol-3-phosphate transport system substrate-binding protein